RLARASTPDGLTLPRPVDTISGSAGQMIGFALGGASILVSPKPLEWSCMRSIHLRLLILSTVLLLTMAGGASACPNCKEAVSAQPAEVADMAQGYNWSIMLMLGVPLSLAGTGAFMVRRAVKK